MFKNENMKYPQITVITVVYNAVETIENTIRSVINQKCHDLEYIIVDGGSTDGTLDIIKKYDFYVDRWISEPDAGIYDAMNKGVAMATGDIIAFLNANDMYVPGALEYVEQQFMNNEIQVLWTRVRYSKNGSMLESNSVELKILPYGMAGCHQGVYASKQIFDDIGGFDAQYKISADYDWLLRVYKKGSVIYCSDEITAIYDRSGVSSNNVQLLRKESKEIAMKYACNDEMCKKIIRHYQKLEFYRRFNSGEIICMTQNDTKFLMGQNVILFGIGKMGKECTKILKQNNVELYYFTDNDFKTWGTIIDGKKVISPSDINLQEDVIVIASTKYEQEIMEQLHSMGMKHNRIVLYSDIRNNILEMLE